MTSLTGQVALVTGGARGIGRGIALALAQAGADVAIADLENISSTAQQYRNAAIGGFTAAHQTAAEITRLGRRSLAIQADVCKKDDAARMVEETLSRLGALHILVCNAGVVSVSSVETMTEETWDLTFAVNVKGVFLSCQAAIPALKARGSSCIINIASIAGKNGAAGLAHYCASKFAVVGFTNSLAKELAPANIRVNAICPGILRTQMWEYLAETLKRPNEAKEDAWQRYVKGLIPLGRPQTPDDIGQLAVYLATAENVTGQAINVDGGVELH
ncbi:MAG TPA: SDR family NAD(P)-dependent oxidoreductase [Candidatus Binatia bacterium]|jgi:meso-butanediol dehydrogenase/(S,S)-butanediol dehydrogenase/diacetyl reductase|nr:SDR family NAD(P)-dependent oxidoreductase [Candidatus Binatia bacterium]